MAARIFTNTAAFRKEMEELRKQQDERERRQQFKTAEQQGVIKFIHIPEKKPIMKVNEDGSLHLTLENIEEAKVFTEDELSQITVEPVVAMRDSFGRVQIYPCAAIDWECGKVLVEGIGWCSFRKFIFTNKELDKERLVYLENHSK